MNWWVYVLRSEKHGKHYVGSTNNPQRRFRQHNGLICGGARFTAGGRPWVPKALFGPYDGRGEAQRAEYVLKKTRSSHHRVTWSPEDSDLCRGLGANDPWVTGT